MSSVVGSGMAKSLMGSVEEMRRPELADLLLLATVTLWALNFTVTKYVISHGFAPLAYGCLRFGGAGSSSHRSLGPASARSRCRRSDLLLLVGAALIGIFLNQLAFVLRDQAHDRNDRRAPVRDAAHADRALRLGTRHRALRLPLLGRCRARVQGRSARRRWARAAAFSGHLWGYLLGLLAPATWAWYSVAICAAAEPYTRCASARSRSRSGTVPLVLAGSPQLAPGLRLVGASVWLSYVFAVLGPLVVANLLWFSSIERVARPAPRSSRICSRSSAAIFSLLILSESITALQVGGGLAIAGGHRALTRRDASRPSVP